MPEHKILRPKSPELKMTEHPHPLSFRRPYFRPEEPAFDCSSTNTVDLPWKSEDYSL